MTEVEDKGSGIEKEAIKNLFHMFNEDASPNMRTKGVGLGLSTARTLTLALQGAISLKTKINEGTKVAFSALTLFEEEQLNERELVAQIAHSAKNYTI